MGRVAFSLPWKLSYMPQGTFKWRLEEWLGVGCARVDSARLGEFVSFPSFRSLIIAGEKDLTLPSIAEAERLAGKLPNNVVHVVEGAGHASTCGSRVDITSLLRARFPELKKRGKKSGRTQMKPIAAKGSGVDLGLESRYDGENIGLNPLLYWSQQYYRPCKRND
jgi:hypothetical protein